MVRIDWLKLAIEIPICILLCSLVCAFLDTRRHSRKIKHGSARTIYIAAPYMSPTLEGKVANVNRVLGIAAYLSAKGYHLFVPHLMHYIDLRAQELGLDIPDNTWVELDLAWLEKCDALLVLELSPGVQREIEFARRHNIPVYYGSLPKDWK